MDIPRIFLAYAPRAGLRCAVAYVAGPNDAYGWYIGRGRSSARYQSAYFVLEDFYTARETRFIAVPDSQLHAKWTLDEARCHELATVQERFTREWLLVGTGPHAALDLACYREAELATSEVNVRFKRLNRFSRLQPNWTFYSQGFEHQVLECLARHWKLDYEPVAAEAVQT